MGTVLRFLRASAVFLFAAPAAGQCMSISEALTLPKNTAPAIFGVSVALHEDLLVVGAPLATGETEWAAGRLYVYRFDGMSWALEAELVAPDGAIGDMLGVSVDTDGERIVAGAWFEDVELNDDGAAYVFALNGSEDWVLEAKLSAAVPAASASFGRTVAIEGDVIAVGAPYYGAIEPVSGRVYLFDRTNGPWQEIETLDPIGNEPYARFGLGLDVDGSRVAIGAPFAGNETGTVDIYSGNGGLWTHQSHLSGSGNEGHFGFDVAISGNHLAVGEYLYGDVGRVHFLEFIDPHWSPNGVFDGDEFGLDAGFGVSVAINGDNALVGSRYGTIDGGTTRSGAVTAFSRTSGAWVQGASITSTLAQSDAEFGWQVSLSGVRGVVGAPYVNQPVDQSGAAFVVELCKASADINGDGMVNGADLGLLLALWGTNDPAGDLNGDGVSNGADLGLMLAAWG